MSTFAATPVAVDAWLRLLVNAPAHSAARLPADLPAMSNLSVQPALPVASLVIPSRGRPDLLRQTVASILEGLDVPAELIVVDQSEAPDQALRQLTTPRPCRIMYKWEPVPGVSRARNSGALHASHDILAFTDDDVVVTPEWFGALVRSLVLEGEHTVVTGRVLPGSAANGDGFVPSTKVSEDPEVFEGRINADVLFSGNMALHRSVFDHVGRFDEQLGPGTRFPAAEDNDFAFRLLGSGYRIVYEPTATLYHVAWRRRRDALSLQWAYGRGQGAFYAKHGSRRDKHTWFRLARDLRSTSRRVARAALRNPRQAVDHAAYGAALLAGAAHWLVRSRGRMRSPASAESRRSTE